MRVAVALFVAILLGFVMLATCIPAWVFSLCEEGVNRLGEWRDEL